MLAPKARGSLSEQVLSALTSGQVSPALRDVAHDGHEDAQVTLWSLYELHYRGFEDVDDALEWHPDLLAVRAGLEAELEATLRDRCPEVDLGDDFAAGLFSFIEDHDGPSVARFVQRDATHEQVMDLLRWRSIYHLKESDPQAWVVPRLSPGPKAALMELQYDEFGNGDPQLLHAHLFAQGLAASGLRPDYGAYIDEAPVEVLEENNAMSLFGLHRRLRAASLGHLAAFEATSSGPSRRMSRGLNRLGFPAEMSAYYDEHVEADAVHEQLAVRTIAGAVVAEDPSLVQDVVLGAFTCLDLEDRFAEAALTRWGANDA
ncbi:iron-containing redox enzyme family protein [Aeromicrobium massiliense]|uniref:iron-containing redox enzyme family protein n=1 Tax=Aeromicrobium massiliense TaxID=1464554 RepID=UPI0005788239|nr:iron-containing redox enzyme family protein [Aeromicrobium massiliense]